MPRPGEARSAGPSTPSVGAGRRDRGRPCLAPVPRTPDPAVTIPVPAPRLPMMPVGAGRRWGTALVLRRRHRRPAMRPGRRIGAGRRSGWRVRPGRRCTGRRAARGRTRRWRVLREGTGGGEDHRRQGSEGQELPSTHQVFSKQGADSRAALQAAAANRWWHRMLSHCPGRVHPAGKPPRRLS